MKATAILSTCLFFLLMSCKKEDETMTNNSCQHLSEPVENIDEEITCWQCLIQCQELMPGTRYDYFYPVYNPNKETEFAYLRFDNTEFTTTHELWVFDYCTGEQRMIHDYALSSVDWSVKDWIIFSAPNHMIYKIKSSGDSLTQLTFSGTYNLSPIWNEAGNQYFYYTQTSGSSGARIIADEEGNLIDTLNFSIRNWDQADRFPYYLQVENGIEVGYFTHTEDTDVLDTISFITNFEDYNYPFFSPRDIAWLNPNTILWSAGQRIGTTNIDNGETEVFLKGYVNRHFSDVSVSPNRKEFLINRIDVSNTEEECRFDNKHRIYLYDIKEGTERWIQIPE